MTTWDQVVMKAWLARSMPDSPRKHPPKADRIFVRYSKNIRRAEVRLTAERMIERYKQSTYAAYERADDHAASYPSYAWQYKYWTDVAADILRILKQGEKSC